VDTSLDNLDTPNTVDTSLDNLDTKNTVDTSVADISNTSNLNAHKSFPLRMKMNGIDVYVGTSTHWHWIQRAEPLPLKSLTASLGSCDVDATVDAMRRLGCVIDSNFLKKLKLFGALADVEKFR